MSSSDNASFQEFSIWKFRVQVPDIYVRGGDDQLGITGNQPVMGCWSVDGVVPMTRRIVRATTDENESMVNPSSVNSEIWECDIHLPSDVRSVQYRYIVCQFLKTNTVEDIVYFGKDVDVRRPQELDFDDSSSNIVVENASETRVVVKYWETSLKPRRRRFVKDMNELHIVQDQFGKLTDKSCSQMKLFCPNHTPKFKRKVNPSFSSSHSTTNISTCCGGSGGNLTPLISTAGESSCSESSDIRFRVPPSPSPSNNEGSRNATNPLCKGNRLKSDVQVQSGWLHTDTLVELKFFGSRALEIWGKKDHKSRIGNKNGDKKVVYSLKLSPLNVDGGSAYISRSDDSSSSTFNNELHDDSNTTTNSDEIDEHTKLWPQITVSEFNVNTGESGCVNQKQSQFGIPIDSNSFISFQIRLFNIHSTAFLVDIYSTTTNTASSIRREDEPNNESDKENEISIDGNNKTHSTEDDQHAVVEHVGSCYISQNTFHNETLGRRSIAVLSKKFRPVGKLVVDYLVIHPLNNGRPLTNTDVSHSRRPSTSSTNLKRTLMEQNTNGKNVVVDKQPRRYYENDGTGFMFDYTFAKHWKDHWNGLYVGHRGSGNSYTSEHYCAHIRENSIASLKNAFAHGADAVEFDVHVSKDLVPIIYHNYEILTKVEKRKTGESELVPVPLKNFTLDQLQHLQILSLEELAIGIKEFKIRDNNKKQKVRGGDETTSSSSEWEEESSLNKCLKMSDCEKPNNDTHADSGIYEEDDSINESDHDAFPTLQQALTEIDSHGAFNIEIKWDMELANGKWESQNHDSFEINVYLDTILSTVMQFAKRRIIFFSSFNPDVCTALRNKQNKYPVLLLTQGLNSNYDSYRDPRTWSIPNGSTFVEMCDIMGLNALATDIIKDPTKIDFVKAKDQIVFCWTDGINDQSTVEYIRSLGVDGVIYDRIEENNKEVKESVFVVDERIEKEHEALLIKAKSINNIKKTESSDLVNHATDGIDMKSNHVNIHSLDETLFDLDDASSTCCIASRLSTPPSNTISQT